MEIKEKEVKKKEYYIKCPFMGCEREIKGTSKSQVEYNMEVHIKQKHNGEDK